MIRVSEWEPAARSIFLKVYHLNFECVDVMWMFVLHKLLGFFI